MPAVCGGLGNTQLAAAAIPTAPQRRRYRRDL